MKIYKVYGSKKTGYSVYIDGIKKNINDIENSIFGNYTNDYGYGVDNILIVIDDDSELKFIDGSRLADKIEPTRVSYSLYKSLSKIAGNMFLTANNYDAETKTIEISKIYS